MLVKTKMNLWPVYSLIGVLLVASIVGISFYFFYQDYQLAQAELAAQREARLADLAEQEDNNSWKAIYPNTKPMKIGEVEVLASVADSMSERITGLSNTPYLPEGVVKFFIFDGPGLHSIWMKDMNYSLDIIWVDDTNTIVHIEEDVSPESYPDFFTPTEEAVYVIEANAGFVAKNNVSGGDSVVLPNL